MMVASGHIMKGGTIVDATIIDASNSTKNAEKKQDPEMYQTKKGGQWRFGMKCHMGADAGSGLVHTIKVSAANEHDITVASKLIRKDRWCMATPNIWGFKNRKRSRQTRT